MKHGGHAQRCLTSGALLLLVSLSGCLGEFSIPGSPDGVGDDPVWDQEPIPGMREAPGPGQVALLSGGFAWRGLDPVAVENQTTADERLHVLDSPSGRFTGVLVDLRHATFIAPATLLAALLSVMEAVEEDAVGDYSTLPAGIGARHANIPVLLVANLTTAEFDATYGRLGAPAPLSFGAGEVHYVIDARLGVLALQCPPDQCATVFASAWSNMAGTVGRLMHQFSARVNVQEGLASVEGQVSATMSLDAARAVRWDVAGLRRDISEAREQTMRTTLVRTDLPDPLRALEGWQAMTAGFDESFHVRMDGYERRLTVVETQTFEAEKAFILQRAAAREFVVQAATFVGLVSGIIALGVQLRGLQHALRARLVPWGGSLRGDSPQKDDAA